MSSESCVAIFGPGLLGGSVALAVQKKMPEVRLHFWARRAGAEAEIRQRGIEGTFSTDVSEVAEGASLIILCSPVEHMPELARKIADSRLQPDALITDVGSVKGQVVQDLEPIFGVRFIGSHPMAGSEKTGIQNAREDLFEKAACLLTPTEMTDPARLDRLRSFWQALGCRMLDFSPIEHDEKVARISHLPHMMAVVTTLAALRGDVEALKCAAGGFRDTTRVAGGDPQLWTGIAQGNLAALRARLQVAAEVLAELLEVLEKPDEGALLHFLSEAKSLRDQLPS